MADEDGAVACLRWGLMADSERVHAPPGPERQMGDRPCLRPTDADHPTLRGADSEAQRRQSTSGALERAAPSAGAFSTSSIRQPELPPARTLPFVARDSVSVFRVFHRCSGTSPTVAPRRAFSGSRFCWPTSWI